MFPKQSQTTFCYSLPYNDTMLMNGYSLPFLTLDIHMKTSLYITDYLLCTSQSDFHLGHLQSYVIFVKGHSSWTLAPKSPTPVYHGRTHHKSRQNQICNHNINRFRNIILLLPQFLPSFYGLCISISLFSASRFFVSVSTPQVSSGAIIRAFPWASYSFARATPAIIV